MPKLECNDNFGLRARLVPVCRNPHVIDCITANRRPTGRLLFGIDVETTYVTLDTY